MQLPFTPACPRSNPDSAPLSTQRLAPRHPLCSGLAPCTSGSACPGPARHVPMPLSSSTQPQPLGPQLSSDLTPDLPGPLPVPPSDPPGNPVSSMCLEEGVCGSRGPQHRTPEVSVIPNCHPEAHLEDNGPKGVRKQETPRCLRFRKACSTSLASDAGSILQKEPLPGSSCERGTLMK